MARKLWLEWEELGVKRAQPPGRDWGDHAVEPSNRYLRTVLAGPGKAPTGYPLQHPMALDIDIVERSEEDWTEGSSNDGRCVIIGGVQPG